MSFKKIVLIGFLSAGPLAWGIGAQQAPSVGAVTLANNATIASASASVGTTVFSGDLLKTGDQGGLTVQAGSLQFTLGQGTSARLFRTENRTVVELESGTLAYTAKGVNEDLTLFASDIRFVPQTNVPAAGQINIASRCHVIATAVHSTIEAKSGRETKTIEETKSYTVLSEFGVDYKDDWQPVLADYPEYPRDAQYHHSHSHVACPAGVWNTKLAIPPLTGHFALAAGGAAAIVTIIVIPKVFESPDRP